jgi:predicted TIM-barrel fold metal-dependent hydrolase
MAYSNPHGFWREDTIPDTEHFCGPDPAMTAAQLLDPYNIDRAVLTFEELLYVGNIPNPYFAAEIARASNDWLVAEWLPADERFYGSILIANQDPELAVEEIHRLGDDPRFVQIIMVNNGVGMSYGHPLFHPIYDAAAEYGLPVAIHAGQSGGVNPILSAGGHPNFYIEYHTLAVQP